MPVGVRRVRMQVDLIRDTAALRHLEPEWNELLADSASDGAFLTYEWLATWWRHFHAGRALHVITVRSGARLIAIAPFVQCRWRMTPPRLVSALEFMGVDAVASEYLDIIVRRGEEPDVIEALGRALAGRSPMLDLSHLQDGASAVSRLEARLGRVGWTARRSALGPCPYIPLEGRTWDDYLGSLGAQHRANFRRRLRDLQKRFAVRFDTVTAEPDRRAALAALIRLHNSRWDERGGSQTFQTPAQLAFHEDATRLFLARGWLRLYTLRLDGEVAAALYGFAYGRKFYVYQSGFDPACRQYSAGLVTMGLAIQASIAEGAAEFDLLFGPESYKTLWAPASRALFAVELCPRNARGRVHRASVHLRDFVRPARQLIRDVFSHA